MGTTAVLIIDSFDVDRVDAAVAAGEMPILAGFLNDAAWCRTRNVVSHRSEMAWAQLLGGKTAADAGWHGWWEFQPDRYVSVGTGAPRVEPFYARDPVESVILDAIQSHPRPEVPGSQLFAWGAHSPQFPRSSIPAGLLTEVLDRIGPSVVFGNDHPIGWYDEAYLRALGEGAADDLRRRAEMVAHVAARTPGWEFLLTTVSEYHAVGHHAWHGVDPTHVLAGVPTAPAAAEAERLTVAAIDEFVGSFLETVGDATVVIGALHGFQAADDLVNCVLLPELLHRLEFGRDAMRDPNQSRWRAAGMPPEVPPAGRHWSHALRARFVPSLRDLPRAALSAAPEPVYDAARRLRGKRPLPPRHDLQPRELAEVDLDDPATWDWPQENLDREVPHWYRRFWPAMRYFAIPSFDDGRIRVNLEGRERDGNVARRDYDQVLAEIEGVVTKITDTRTGEPLAREILFDRAADPMADGGPDADVIIRWRASTDAIDHPDVGTIGPHPFMRTASHREDGWYGVRGAGVSPGREARRAGADRVQPDRRRAPTGPDLRHRRRRPPRHRREQRLPAPDGRRCGFRNGVESERVAHDLHCGGAVVGEPAARFEPVPAEADQQTQRRLHGPPRCPGQELARVAVGGEASGQEYLPAAEGPRLSAQGCRVGSLPPHEHGAVVGLHHRGAEDLGPPDGVDLVTAVREVHVEPADLVEQRTVPAHAAPDGVGEPLALEDRAHRRGVETPRGIRWEVSAVEPAADDGSGCRRRGHRRHPLGADDVVGVGEQHHRRRWWRPHPRCGRS